MTTATKITSLDKVQSIAVENGWNVEVTKVTKAIKDPSPGTGVGYGRRRNYVPYVNAEVWQVTLSNTDALNAAEYEGLTYGLCTAFIYFTEDGKYVAELTGSSGYHLYAGKPLKDVLNLLEQHAPAKIQAHILSRISENAAHKQRKIDEAQAKYDERFAVYSKARQGAAEALRRLGLTDDQWCAILDAIDEPEGAMSEFVGASLNLSQAKRALDYERQV